MAPNLQPGVLISVKVRWNTAEPDPTKTQLFAYAPTVVAHPLPCIVEEVVAPADPKGDYDVKLRILVPKASIPPKTEIKLKTLALHDRADAIVQE